MWQINWRFLRKFLFFKCINFMIFMFVVEIWKEETLTNIYSFLVWNLKKSNWKANKIHLKTGFFWNLRSVEKDLLANSVKISFVEARNLLTFEQDSYHVKTLEMKLLTMNKKPLDNSSQILDNSEIWRLFHRPLTWWRL